MFALNRTEHSGASQCRSRRELATRRRDRPVRQPFAGEAALTRSRRYWLLLEPHRTRKAAPAGMLILRQDGKPVRVEVPVTDALLGEVQRLIRDVRVARKKGVLPRVCGCQVCSRLRCDEVTASVTERKDVTMIWGVGRVFGAALEAAGSPAASAMRRTRRQTSAGSSRAPVPVAKSTRPGRGAPGSPGRAGTAARSLRLAR